MSKTPIQEMSFPQAAVPVTAPLQSLMNSQVRYQHITGQTEAGEVKLKQRKYYPLPDVRSCCLTLL